MPTGVNALFAVALGIIAMAMLLAAGYALVTYWWPAAPLRPSDPRVDWPLIVISSGDSVWGRAIQATGALPTPEVTLTGAETRMDSTDGGVEAVVESIDPSRGHANWAFILYVKCSSLSRISLGDERTSAMELADRGEALVLRVLLAEGETTQDIPLRSFHACHNDQFNPESTQLDTWHSDSVTLPLVGGSRIYPSDVYITDALISVEIPQSLAFSTATGNEAKSLTLNVWAAMGARMAGTDSRYTLFGLSGLKHTRLEHDLRLFETNLSPMGFSVLVTRDAPSRIFAYTTALIPLAMALLLFHVLFVSRSIGNEPVHHLLLNVAAAMIAVLPLRQVLVPGQIAGLTRVDLLLGTGLVAIISMALIRYAMWIWPGAVGVTVELPAPAPSSGTDTASSPIRVMRQGETVDRC